MDGAEPGAREHREHGFRYARHVDEDAVAFPQPQRPEGAGERGYLPEHLVVGERADGVREGLS